MLFGDIKRAVADETDVVLFNIDAKAGHGQRLRPRPDSSRVPKVLNELQGYSGDHPHIANVERFLDGKGEAKGFEELLKSLSGNDWRAERDAYEFHQNQIVKSLSETLGQSEEVCIRWIEGAEDKLPSRSRTFVDG